MITLVCGLPGSGKTTWARARQAETGGYVIDLDAILDGIAGCAPHTRTHPKAAYNCLVNMIWQLAGALSAEVADVYAIRTAPAEAEMRLYGLKCARVLIDTPMDVCEGRLRARGDYRPGVIDAARVRLIAYWTKYGAVTRTIESADACGFCDLEGSK